MSARILALGSSTLLALATSARAGVLLVGPGQPFRTLQAAVNAAVDGDTLIVKPGSYAQAEVAGKSLTIAGDGATRPVIQGALSVHDLAVGQTVVVSRVQGRVSCASNAGEVRLADCVLTGTSLVESSGTVAFSGCELRGDETGGIADTGGTDGGAGLACRGTRVALYDCTVRGGRGQDDITFAGDGGPGLRLSPSLVGLTTFAHISHSTLSGGRGGDTWEDLLTGIAIVGDGGNGLQSEIGTSAWMIGDTLTGGSRGAWHICFPADYGTDGTDVGGSGRRTTFNASSLSMSGASLVRDDQSLTLTIEGQPGDAVWLFRGARASFAAQASWRGALLESWNRPQYEPTAPYVVLDGSGHGTITLPLAPVDPSSSGEQVFLQAYRVHPSGTLTIGSVLPVTVVDASY